MGDEPDTNAGSATVSMTGGFRQMASSDDGIR